MGSDSLLLDYAECLVRVNQRWPELVSYLYYHNEISGSSRAGHLPDRKPCCVPLQEIMPTGPLVVTEDRLSAHWGTSVFAKVTGLERMSGHTQRPYPPPPMSPGRPSFRLFRA